MDSALPLRPRRSPPNKGRRYPPDPPRVEEIVAVMRRPESDRTGYEFVV